MDSTSGWLPLTTVWMSIHVGWCPDQVPESNELNRIWILSLQQQYFVRVRELRPSLPSSYKSEDIQMEYGAPSTSAQSNMHVEACSLALSVWLPRVTICDRLKSNRGVFGSKMVWLDGWMLHTEYSIRWVEERMSKVDSLSHYSVLSAYYLIAL